MDGLYAKRRDEEKIFILNKTSIEFRSVSRNFLLGTDDIDQLAYDWYDVYAKGKLALHVESQDLGM